MNNTGAGVGALIIVFGALFLLSIFIMRAVGAWMLRINEIIELQKQSIQIMKGIRDELRKPKTDIHT